MKTNIFMFCKNFFFTFKDFNKLVLIFSTQARLARKKKTIMTLNSVKVWLSKILSMPPCFLFDSYLQHIGNNNNKMRNNRLLNIKYEIVSK